jgi:molybdopterin-guanine dinucleotide biosynthesis protein A
MEIGGLSLIERVKNALAGYCDELLLVGGNVQPGGVRHVADRRSGRQGPLAGIEAGLAAARFDRVFVAAGDMPFLTQSLVGYLLGRLEGGDARAVVPRYGSRTHPLCAAYSRALLPRVGAALDSGVLAVRGMLEGIDGVDYVEELGRFGDPDVLLMNVNSPPDLALARRMAER